jgi:hypothetical protein
MRIRTDSNQFTDTEIYALGYCCYSTAVFALLHASLIKQEAVGDREALETQFANSMDGLLKPLPPDPMGKASGVRRFKILGSSHTSRVLLKFSSETVHSSRPVFVARWRRLVKGRA